MKCYHFHFKTLLSRVTTGMIINGSFLWSNFFERVCPRSRKGITFVSYNFDFIVIQIVGQLHQGPRASFNLIPPGPRLSKDPGLTATPQPSFIHAGLRISLGTLASAIFASFFSSSSSSVRPQHRSEDLREADRCHRQTQQYSVPLAQKTQALVSACSAKILAD